MPPSSRANRSRSYTLRLGSFNTCLTVSLPVRQAGAAHDLAPDAGDLRAHVADAGAQQGGNVLVGCRELAALGLPTEANVLLTAPLQFVFELGGLFAQAQGGCRAERQGPQVVVDVGHAPFVQVDPRLHGVHVVPQSLKPGLALPHQGAQVRHAGQHLWNRTSGGFGQVLHFGGPEFARLDV